MGTRSTTRHARSSTRRSTTWFPYAGTTKKHGSGTSSTGYSKSRSLKTAKTRRTRRTKTKSSRLTSARPNKPKCSTTTSNETATKPATMTRFQSKSTYPKPTKSKSTSTNERYDRFTGPKNHERTYDGKQRTSKSKPGPRSNES